MNNPCTVHPSPFPAKESFSKLFCPSLSPCSSHCHFSHQQSMLSGCLQAIQNFPLGLHTQSILFLLSQASHNSLRFISSLINKTLTLLVTDQVSNLIKLQETSVRFGIQGQTYMVLLLLPKHYYCPLPFISLFTLL